MAYKFTKGQTQFINSLSSRTGLNRRVVAAWVFSEMNGGYAAGRERQGYYNWLNIGHTDSGNLGLTKSKLWGSPDRAAAATADFLNGKRFGPGPGIKKIINYAGKSPEAQIRAIATSGWASSSYEKGNTLRSIYKGLGGQFAGSSKPAVSVDKTTGGAQAAATQSDTTRQAILSLIADRSSSFKPIKPIKPSRSKSAKF